MQFKDQICDLPPPGLESFYLPSFLSAGLFGGSTANKRYIISAPRLCGEKILLKIRQRDSSIPAFKFNVFGIIP
jgi:hypothetical protein